MLGSRVNGRKEQIPFIGLKGEESAVLEPGRVTREGEAFQELCSVVEEYSRLGNLAGKEPGAWIYHPHSSLSFLPASRTPQVERHRNWGQRSASGQQN